MVPPSTLLDKNVTLSWGLKFVESPQVENRLLSYLNLATAYVYVLNVLNVSFKYRAF